MKLIATGCWDVVNVISFHGFEKQLDTNMEGKPFTDYERQRNTPPGQEIAQPQIAEGWKAQMWEHQCIFSILCSFLASSQNWPLLETKKPSLQSVVLLNTSSFTNQLRISLKILALEPEEIIFNYKHILWFCVVLQLQHRPLWIHPFCRTVQGHMMRNTSHAQDNLGRSLLSGF